MDKWADLEQWIRITRNTGIGIPEKILQNREILKKLITIFQKKLQL